MVRIKENMSKIDKDFSSQQARISMIKKLLDFDSENEKKMCMTVPDQPPRIDSHWSKKRQSIFFHNRNNKSNRRYNQRNSLQTFSVLSSNDGSETITSARSIQPNKNDLVSDQAIADRRRVTRTYHRRENTTHVTSRETVLDQDFLQSHFSTTTTNSGLKNKFHLETLSNNDLTRDRNMFFSQTRNSDQSNLMKSSTIQYSDQVAKLPTLVKKELQSLLMIIDDRIKLKDSLMNRSQYSGGFMSPVVDSLLKQRAIVLSGIQFITNKKPKMIDLHCLKQVEMKYCTQPALAQMVSLLQESSAINLPKEERARLNAEIS